MSAQPAPNKQFYSVRPDRKRAPAARHRGSCRGAGRSGRRREHTIRLPPGCHATSLHAAHRAALCARTRPIAHMRVICARRGRGSVNDRATHTRRSGSGRCELSRTCQSRIFIRDCSRAQRLLHRPAGAGAPSQEVVSEALCAHGSASGCRQLAVFQPGPRAAAKGACWPLRSAGRVPGPCGELSNTGRRARSNRATDRPRGAGQHTPTTASGTSAETRASRRPESRSRESLFERAARRGEALLGPAKSGQRRVTSQPPASGLLPPAVRCAHPR